MKQKKTSALMISLALHGIILFLTIIFVVVRVSHKEEHYFEAKPVSRPTMKLRKLQVPVNMRKKKMRAPKLRKTIVSKPKTPSVDIKMPEITGIKGGMGSAYGGGLGGIGFNLDLDLFGAGRGTGNEFRGTFYDLKQTADGEVSDIGELPSKDRSRAARAVIKDFASSGFSPKRMGDYFKAPKKKYTTFFMIPEMPADEAPKAFGVEGQVEPGFWVCHYKGQIAAPETGRYRFCGIGDDVMLVRIKNRLVLDASLGSGVTSWRSDDANNRRFPLEHVNKKVGGGGMVIGDWFNLKKGDPVDMDVLLGESPGSRFCAVLLVEQKGKSYEMVETEFGPRPVLPIFKTTPVPDELVEKMKIKPDQQTIAGPVFGVLKNARK